MREKPPVEPIFGRKSFNKIKQRFLRVAEQRLQLTQAALSERQQIFFDVLPLLFHINHPLLPGFVSSDAPAGIPDYTPTKTTLLRAKKYSRSFSYNRRAFRTYPIHSLFLMGSGGTIAYSKKSDFDIWVCYDPTMAQHLVDILSQKCVAIEQWAMTLGLEIYFYLINPERFRQGDNLDLSAESSGDTQHHLLLEEFYRTGLWLAGRVPVWWYVPPEHDADYCQYVQTLQQKRFIDPHETFDVGGLEHVDAKEFFTAALWQLYKGIDAPYKSMLKMMLMEVYATEYPQPDWLSHRLKQVLYSADVKDITEIDPYVLMCEKLEQYLSHHDEKDRLNLMRESFYFKADETLTKTSGKDPQRVAVLHALVRRWGWDNAKLHALDHRAQWKIFKVKTERKRLSLEFSKSYRKLTKFAQAQGCEDLMHGRDLHILGRKLYAALDKRPGKIERINLGISQDMVEPLLTIQQKMGTDHIVWTVYVGMQVIADLQSSKIHPFYQNRYLVPLLIWCQVNGVINHRSKFTLHLLQESVEIDEFHAIFNAIGKWGEQLHMQPGMTDFAVPARLHAAVVFVNVGLDPFAELTRKGAHLISGRNDALSYGGVWVNLGLTFDWVMRNSWGEVFVKRFEDIGGLLTCLCHYLDYSTTTESLPTVACYSFSSVRGPSIAHRITQLFTDVRAAFAPIKQRPAWYLIHAEQSYCMILSAGESFRYHVLADDQELLALLGEVRTTFTPCFIDAFALEHSPLKTIYPFNQANRIQLFFYVKGTVAEVYVLDEKGALFFHKQPYQGEQRLLRQYDSFLLTVQARRQLLESMDDAEAIEIEFYALHKRHGQFRVTKRQVPTHGNGDFFDVKVVAENIDRHQIDYTIFCNTQEFSSLAYGDKIFEQVASYILACRATGESYPMYVTDIDVSPALLGVDQHPVQTVDYLQYKKKIERKLNQTMLAKGKIL